MFYEMREDEEIKFENKEDRRIDVPKSTIAKELAFRFTLGLKIPGGIPRKKNTEIQTYNVDFLLDQEKTREAFEEAAQRDRTF
jgi:hypothetical protein